MQSAQGQPGTRQKRARTALQRLNEQANNDMIRGGDPMNLERLAEIAGPVNERLCQETLTARTASVSDEKGMFGEFCAPSQDGGDKCGMQRRDVWERWTVSLKLEATAELFGVEQGKAGVDDLEKNFDEIQGEPEGEGSDEVRRKQNDYG